MCARRGPDPDPLSAHFPVPLLVSPFRLAARPHNHHGHRISRCPVRRAVGISVPVPPPCACPIDDGTAAHTAAWAGCRACSVVRAHAGFTTRPTTSLLPERWPACTPSRERSCWSRSAAQTRIGIVWDRPFGEARQAGADKKLKAITAWLADVPPLPAISLRFAEWMARYTLSPLGMVVRMMMGPPGVFEPGSRGSASACNAAAPSRRA